MLNFIVHILTQFLFISLFSVFETESLYGVLTVLEIAR